MYFESRSGSSLSRGLFLGFSIGSSNTLPGPWSPTKKSPEAEELFNLHFGGRVFNRRGWEHILNKHGGHLPVEIKAVPEGTVVKESNVLMTVENTDPAAFWLTNYLETLLVQVWYPSTVATQSRAMKIIILKYLALTGDESLVAFKLHDFGFRGVTCPEQAAIGGTPIWSTSWAPTRWRPCFVRKFYGEKMAGF